MLPRDPADAAHALSIVSNSSGSVSGGTSVLVGGVRIGQLRLRPGACEVPASCPRGRFCRLASATSTFV